MASSALDRAYAFCERITKDASSTFYLGSRLFPRHMRRHVWAVYAFCRYADDIVDERQQRETVYAGLLLSSLEIVVRDAFERKAFTFALGHQIKDRQLGDMQELHIALADTFEKFSALPIDPFLELLEGIRRDLSPIIIRTTDELNDYCDHVAGTVGLLICGLCGITDPHILQKAVQLGNAMQITNILRDIGEDEREGRCYIPLELRQFYGLQLPLHDSYIHQHQSFVLMMERMILQNRKDYASALPALRAFPVRIRIALCTAALMYEDILSDIEKRSYNVFSYRAYVPLYRKLWCLLRSFSLLL